MGISSSLTCEIISGLRGFFSYLPEFSKISKLIIVLAKKKSTQKIKSKVQFHAPVDNGLMIINAFKFRGNTTSVSGLAP